MEPNSLAIIPTAPTRLFSNDTDYRYRPDSDFYYMTGFREPGACAIISSADGIVPYTLFVRPRDRDKEIWNGRREGVDGAKENFHADEAFVISEVDEKLDKMMENRDRIYHFPGRYSDWDTRLLTLWQKNRLKWRDGIDAPVDMVDLTRVIHEMRLIKSEDEISIMRESCRITADAHELAMRSVRPGMNERELEALVEHFFRASGAYGPGYPTIVASGANACVLHYIENNCTIKDGDLVLIDAGCEYEMYSSDITRTFPANGKFSPEQRAIYDIVLETNISCIAKTVVGATIGEVQDHAIRSLTTGLIDLKLIKVGIDEAIEKEIYKKFYMHKIGHWLGIDVHDAGSSRSRIGWRKYEPGMIMTIEPGIYIPENDVEIPENFRGIGIRTEDDILITEKGPENLTSSCLKKPEQVEELVGTKEGVEI